jgi:hypothetical protein
MWCGVQYRADGVESMESVESVDSVDSVESRTTDPGESLPRASLIAFVCVDALARVCPSTSSITYTVPTCCQVL